MGVVAVGGAGYTKKKEQYAQNRARMYAKACLHTSQHARTKARTQEEQFFSQNVHRCLLSDAVQNRRRAQTGSSDDAEHRK